jgi:hypothetical protein
MDPEKLDSFCQIYKDNAILDKYSLIDIMLDLQIKTNDLQGIMFNSFSSSSTRSTNYDDLIYTTIYGLTYDKGADIEYIDKWLKEFEIDIDDIVKNNFGSNEIGKYISVKHNDFHGTQEDKRKAHLIQVEFLDYFLKFYAGNFQSKIYSGFDVTYKNEWKYIKLSGLDVEYLNNFCKSVFDEKIATKSSSRFNITDLASKLEVEITENIINSSDNKIESYLHRVITALNERQKNILFSEDKMDKWVSKFDIDLEDFPYFKNEELSIILNKEYSGTHNSVDERKDVFQIQTDFYFYVSLIETDKLIKFLNSNSSKQLGDKKIIENKVLGTDSKQLTVNQSVILLDKLGLFKSAEFEDVPNTKKALLLSKLLGRNDKNIKKSIEMLELKPQDLTLGCRNDYSIIQQLLDKR